MDDPRLRRVTRRMVGDVLAYACKPGDFLEIRVDLLIRNLRQQEPSFIALVFQGQAEE